MRIVMPWNNLGCLGVQVREWYGDLHWSPSWGLFVNDGKSRRWLSLTGKLKHIADDGNPEMEKVYRKTMTPWALLKDRAGNTVECTSFPAFHEGAWMVYARRTPGEPCSAKYIRCSQLRPIQYD